MEAGEEGKAVSENQLSFDRSEAGHPNSFPAMKRDDGKPDIKSSSVLEWNESSFKFDQEPITIKGGVPTHRHSVHFFRVYGEPMLTLHPNGIIEVGKNCSADEAGKAFIDYVREHWHNEASCRRIRELEERIALLETTIQSMEADAESAAFQHPSARK